MSAHGKRYYGERYRWMFYDPRKTAYFKEMLVTVVGQALDAAGYTLEDSPLQQARGLLRYSKRLEGVVPIYGFIEWQLLAFEQSTLARFQITLLRNQGHDARAVTSYPERAERTLPWIIWHIFEARILPADDHWWVFRGENDLPQALADAGRLLFGYGVPWLEMRDDVPDG